MITRAAAAKSAFLTLHRESIDIFEDGIRSIFRQWTALELALFHQWGGQNGQIKVETLVQEILSLFLKPEKVYKDDVSFILEDFMDIHFATECEDGSPEEIGELMVKMWRECLEGNYVTVINTKAKEATRNSMVAVSQGLEGGDVINEEEENEMDEEQYAINNQILIFQTAFSLKSENNLQQVNTASNESYIISSSIANEIIIPQPNLDSSAPPISIDLEGPSMGIDPEGWETVARGKNASNKKKKSKSYVI